MSLRTDQAHLISLSGEYDVGNSDSILTAVLTALPDSPERIELDMSRVTFFGSTALGALISARAACAASDSRLAVIQPSAAVGRILQITGTAPLFA